jgi:hypothetical protein
MRRLRESGIVTILLLGLTGCAGVQQRMGWSETSPMVGDNADERPLSRLAFWRRHRAEESAAADSAVSSRPAMIAGNEKAADDDEERPSLLRRLPLVGRLWKGGDHDESDDVDLPAARYSPGALNAAPVAYVPPRTPARTASSPSGPPATGDSPAVSPVAEARPAETDPAPTPATASTSAERPAILPLRELAVDLAGVKPQVDAAAVPARNAGAPAQPAPPIAGSPDQQSAPATLPEPPPIRTLNRDDVPPPTAAPGPQPNVETPDLSPSTTNRAPSLPATSTSQPAAASMVTSTPGLVWPVSSQTIFPGSSQSVVMSSAQGGYVSGGCEPTCGPKCKVHKLCPLKKHKQRVIESSVVLPSSQGIVSSCEAPCKVKKECFLKAWLHHKSDCKLKGCKGCKTCAYCGEAPAIVSAQTPLVSSQW